MALSIEDCKTQAKRLRAAMAERGTAISHSEALEAVARQHGAKDWNTLHARIGNRPPGPPIEVGQTVEGAYLGRPVRGEVKSVRAMADGSMFEVSLELDEPVNVSDFESFEVLRRRLRATIRRSGETVEKISSGAPHLALKL